MPDTDQNLNRAEVANLNALIEKRLKGERKLTFKETLVLGVYVDKHFDKVVQLIQKKERELALAK